MKLQDIEKRYRENGRIQDFSQQLRESKQGRFRLKGLAGSQFAFLLSAIYHNSHKNTLIILNDKEDALYFHNDLQAVMPRKDLLYFPASYKRPYQIEEIDNANVLQRAEVLNQLNHTHSGRQVIITFAEALSDKVINKRSLVKNTLEVRKGDTCGMDFIIEALEEYGFERSEFVYEPGNFAVRGGILDVYSFATELPVRIEFFGNEIESIRSFDPVDQISQREEGMVSLIPNIQRHLVDEQRVSLLEYISESTVVFVQNLDFVLADIEKQYGRAEKYFEELQGRSGGAATSKDPSSMYLSEPAFLKQLEEFTLVEFGSKAKYRKFDGELEWSGSPQPRFQKEFNLLAQHLHQHTELGIDNVILSENPKQVARLREIFDEIDHDAHFDSLEGVIHEGFLDKQINLALYTDHQIFERYHRYKARSHTSRSQALTLKELQELQPGDYVTHITHGIGQFAGLHRIRTGDYEQEAIKIIYRGGDEIFVNVNSLYKISKYSGKDGAIPKLSKLGSGEWAKAKAKTKTRLKELAFDLISLYAQRKAQKGFAFQPDSYMQRELEANFLYVDTPDQEKATEAVKADMENPTPMDRLICGDVGFGKTEVAVRAAFKAAVSGKQTAILVPTTILALQHYHTFKERLKDMPVEVDYLNRYKSAKEIKETLDRAANGKIDILIGTHRIVSKDVKFKDLGLLIIDEEQKFGVGVKEKLKTMKVNVDTLTLTATPIPRTLQFSLMGVRDLSIIQTPPPNRQPVETVVTTMDHELLRDAISYEMKRGGQVFFVHNRVHDLDEIGAMVKKLVPDARIALAHGQLTGPQMEKIMSDFIEGEYDVLVATTIIESGLDIPNANTIIINQAQNFGLSDLHQMRGRVGRSNRKAFCYLIAPHESVLSSDSRKRLKAIEEFNDLGSGFHIALRDLDIRGAGDMLGPEQSGFINEVGYEIFHKILDEAVLELKEEHFEELFKEEIKKRREMLVEDTQVEHDQMALIPESYLPGIPERLKFYNRIANAESEDDLRNISIELMDRFGPIPAEVLALFDTVRIRWIGRQLGFEKVVLKDQTLRLYFPSDQQSAYYSNRMFATILGWAQSPGSNARFKESPKYLSLVVHQVVGIKGSLSRMRQVQDFVKEIITQQ